MKEIKLNTGKIAMVDDQDFDWLSQFKWTEDSQGYAYRVVYQRPKNRSLRMHRAILEYMNVDLVGKEVDHINQVKLDNRRENLRGATRAQNVMNTGLRVNNKSGYKGVFPTSSGKWDAIIHAGKRIKIGFYNTKEEAAKAYNDKAVELYGEFAVLNVLKERE